MLEGRFDGSGENSERGVDGVREGLEWRRCGLRGHVGSTYYGSKNRWGTESQL